MSNLTSGDGALKIAVFIDLENLAVGVGDAKNARFDIRLVLGRLIEKGDVVVKKAYADWGVYQAYKRALHEAVIELIEMPGSKLTGKNSSDIKMVVDALELCYTKPHVNAFALVSGDSDFSPLVSKLRENDKYVIGLGVKSSSSELLVDNCDEFIYYEDLIRVVRKPGPVKDVPEKTAEAFELLTDAIEGLMRENKEVLWGSMVKQTIMRKRPSFNESYYGFRTFSKLLEEAARHKLLEIKKDQKSGTYIITGFTEAA